jgi:hypothetical protein
MRPMTVATAGRFLGHGNGFVKPHSDDGVAGARKGTAVTMLMISGAMLVLGDA